MNDRIAVITGATSGLGQNAAISLARRAFHVVVVGRDEARARDTLEGIARAGSSGSFQAADLFSMSDVAALAARITAAHPRIDLLVNNAGGTFTRVERTVDGLERTFALNVAAPFVLTEALIPALAPARGRVLNVVTGVGARASTTVEAIAGSSAGAGMGAYINAKLALIALTIEQQNRHRERGLTFVSLHPGIIPSTRFGSEWPEWFRRMGPVVAHLFGMATTEQEAAARYVEVATAPVEPAGFYWEGVLRAPPHRAADPSFRRELWERLEVIATRAALARAA